MFKIVIFIVFLYSKFLIAKIFKKAKLKHLKNASCKKVK